MKRKQINNRLLQLIPLLIILSAVLLFFWKFFIKGLIPIPADITVGMYYPWLDYKWGYLVGVPVKNSLLSDVVSQIYPLRTYAMNQIKSGILPLWNPMMFAGYPFIANIQVGILNPTNLLFFIFSYPIAWGLQSFLQPLMAAIFTYFFLRFLKIGRIASVFGGLVFAFSGFNVIWMEWNVHAFTVAFLPLLFYLTNLFFKDEKKRFIGPLISLVFCLQIFSGYPQVTVYSVFTLLLYVFFIYGFTKRAVLCLFWMLLGIFMSAVQLFPTMELFVNSQRKLEVLYPHNYSFPWRYLTSFVAPDFFGNPTTGNYWGNGDYTDNVGYTGIVSFIFSIYFVIFQKRKTKQSIFFIYQFIIVFLLLLCGRLPFFIKFLQYVGLGALAPTRILFLLNLSLALTGSFALDIFIKTGLKIKEILSLIGIQIIGVWSLLFGSLIFYFLKPLSKNIYIGIRNLFYPCVYCVILIGLLLAFLSPKKVIRFLSAVLIIFLAIFELFRFGWKYLSFTPEKLIFPSTPIIDYLKEQKGIFRVEGGEVIPMNMLLPYGLESYSAYDPMYPLVTAQYMSLIDGGDINNPKSRYGQVHRFDSPLFDLVNVCYILALKKDNNSKPDQEGKISSMFQSEKFKVVFEDKITVVVKNLNCYPRAFLISDFSETNSNEVTIKLTDKISKDTIIWEKYTPLFKEAKVSAEKETLFFISDIFYPGWKALVDNKETKVLKANNSFQAIKISKGEHKIVLIYKSISFFIGLTISIISGTLILLVLFLGYFGEKLPLLKKKKV